MLTNEQFEMEIVASGMMQEGCNKEEIVGYLAIMGYKAADIKDWYNNDLGKKK